MEKITLENIASYLPYKMIGKSLGGRMYYLDTFSNMRGDGIENREIGTFINEHFKPILYPMDLTKPIIIEGKEIVPIVELASLVIPHVTWELHEGADRVINEIGRGFCYDKPTKSFQYWEYYDWLTVPNQLALFQWLFKHKFDVFGLIEQNLAIDVDSLEINPYE